MLRSNDLVSWEPCGKVGAQKGFEREPLVKGSASIWVELVPHAISLVSCLPLF